MVEDADKSLALSNSSSDTPCELEIEFRVSPDWTVYVPPVLELVELVELVELAWAGVSSSAALAGATPNTVALAAVARPARPMENFLFRRDRSASASAFSASMRARRVV